MSEERLIAPCLARPEDDAPRFEYANAVGGERGELVAIQCVLARGPLRRDLSVERKRREIDLLERNATAWSGLDQLAEGVRFRRGFVDFAAIDAEIFATRAEEIFRIAPFLRHVELLGLHHVELAVIASRLERALASPAFARLRGLTLDYVGNTVERDSDYNPTDFESGGSDALSTLVKCGALRGLDTLCLPRCALSSSDIKRLAGSVDAAGLRRLDLQYSAVGRYMGLYPEDVATILASPHLGKVEALDIGGALGHAPWLAGQTKAERQERSMEQAKRDPELLTNPRILGMRRLGIAYGAFTDGMIDAIANAPFTQLEWLDLSRNDIFGEDFARFGAAPGLAHLEELVFDGPSKYVFDVKMAEALGNASRFDALRTLRLRNCYMKVEAASVLLRSPLARRLDLIDLRKNRDVAEKAKKDPRGLRQDFDGILLVD